MKTDFFKFGLYRLAGGIDNSLVSDETPVIGVRTQSFSIELMKFSAANLIKIPVEFNMAATTMQDNMNQEGTLTL